MFKRIIRKMLNSVQYDLVRLNNNDKEQLAASLKLYESLYPPDSISNKRFYNVGSGSFYHPYWTNLDYVSDWYKPFQKNVVHIDLMQKGSLPVETDSAEVVYTSHTIEHIKEDAVLKLFEETWRMLKKGGVFRVTTGPDADLEYLAMKRNDANWFYWDTWYATPGTYEFMFHKPANSVPIEERWLHHVASQLAVNDISPSPVKMSASEIRQLVDKYTKEELLDYLTSKCEFQPGRVGNHVSWWNYSKIERFLRQAGFTNIYRSGYSQSSCPILRDVNYFDNTHPQMSVYAEAIKT